MKVFLFVITTLLTVFASAQMKDRGAYKQPIPITNNSDLRHLDAALYYSGFIFNDDVRQEYFDHCLALVTPKLKFNEKTWDWLMENPAVLNATFALEYPPNPNIIHNFLKLAKLVGPVYAKKYEQLLIAFAVQYRGERLLDSSLTADRYGMIEGRNFTWDPKRKAQLEQDVAIRQAWAVNHDINPSPDGALARDSNGNIYKDERTKQDWERRLHERFDLGNNNDAKRVTNWLKQNGKVKIYEIMSLARGAFQNKTGIALSGEPKDLPWDKIAHVAGRFPPRMEGSIIDNLCLRIMRYEEKGAEKSGLFPLSKAPWPLLLLLTQKDPVDESTYWWTMYKQKGSVPGYSTYSFDYTKPEIRYNDGAWHPDATPRILVDGGVCGRLSTMAEFAQRSIGTPAQGMGQPGHRAFMTYSYDPGSKRYSAVQHHSVDTIEVSTVGWYLPPIYGPVHDPKTKLTNFQKMLPSNTDAYTRDNIRWHIGLCEAMNLGLASWEDSRMALHILDIYTSASEEWMNASIDQQEALLRSALVKNIANTDVVFRLAGVRKGKANKILDLIQGFTNAFVSISDGCTGDKAMARNTNFGNTTAGADLTALLRNNFSYTSNRNVKKVKNEWALFIRHAIFIGAFTNIPDEADPKYAGSRIEWVVDKNAYAKAVEEELKYQKKLANTPFLAEIQRLNDKYDKVRMTTESRTKRNNAEMRQRRIEEENTW